MLLIKWDSFNNLLLNVSHKLRSRILTRYARLIIFSQITTEDARSYHGRNVGNSKDISFQPWTQKDMDVNMKTTDYTFVIEF